MGQKLQTAAELRALADRTLTFEAKVQDYLDQAHEQFRQATAMARQGEHQIDLLVVAGKVDQETDTPIAVAWRRLAAEFSCLGYTVRVLPEPLVGIDTIYGYKTHFRLVW